MKYFDNIFFKKFIFYSFYLIENEFLKKISGACVNYSFVSRPKLSQFKLFIPENVLLGANDRIGGITRGIKKRNIFYIIFIDNNKTKLNSIKLNKLKSMRRKRKNRKFFVFAYNAMALKSSKYGLFMKCL